MQFDPESAPTAGLINFPSKSPSLSPSIKRSYDGPVSGPMWKTVSSLNSRYPDNFDWSVYDRIHAKYESAPPRGGVVFRTTFKLANYHTSCSRCHYSLELDTYGRGCVHNCMYCYAKDQLSVHAYWNEPQPFPVDLAQIRKILYTVFETDKPSKWRAVLGQRIPVRIGSMSDSFMWMEKRLGVTKELLKILKYYQYPHIIFTRSDLVATDEYLAVLDPGLASVQFSISGNNEKLTKAIEPGAPSVERRLKALKRLSENCFWTTVRINPFFPMYPDGYFSDRESVIERFGSLDKIPKFDLFEFSFFDQLVEARVPSVLAGFVRLSPRLIDGLSQASKTDFKSFFKPDLYKRVGDKRYSDLEIKAYYKLLQKEARKRNLRFSTCYIGNGEKDYHQYQDLWVNKNDCCDAKGNVRSFTSTCQTIPWAERLKHAPDKELALAAKQSESAFNEKLTLHVSQGTDSAENGI